MQRAGQNLKAQIRYIDLCTLLIPSNKLEVKEVKLEYVFPTQPPMPISNFY